MKCVYVLKGGAWPCRQCLPCRLKIRREWTNRIMLESKSHDASVFVTLTYSEDNVPRGLTLEPDHTRKWLYRFRNALQGRRFRYYLVGEYGDITQRPHYHAVLFGVSQNDSHLVSATWKFGHIRVDPLTIERAQYIAGYVTKKMTKVDDPRLFGRHPEFSRMSKMGDGGIGAPYMPKIAKTLLTNSYAKAQLDEEGDVPFVLKHSGRAFPTGRYLRSKLRVQVGLDFSSEFSTDKIRAEAYREQAFQDDLQLLREGSITLEEFDQAQGFIRGAEKVDQMALNLAGRLQIKKRRM
nr:MAG: replication initiator protein [Microvirus sp.]